MEDPVDALLGRRFDGLRLTKVLGMGTYGAVYVGEDERATAAAKQQQQHAALPPLSNGMLARRTSQPTRVAVKCLFKQGLQPEQIDLQRNEIDLNRRIGTHPNIMRLERVFEDAEHLMLVFEYCERGDLFELIRKEEAGIFDKAFACELFVQLIDAVAHCHRQGVFHRDLKPENVLLTEDWTVKLGDFGLATVNRYPVEFECGSPPYMAPEVFVDPANPRRSYSAGPADVWSLGVIFFNMIYGQNPWERAIKTDRHFRAFLEQPFSSLSVRFAMSSELLEIFLSVFEIEPMRRCTLSQLRDAVRIVNLQKMHPTANKYSSSPAVNLQHGFMRQPPRQLQKMPLPAAVHHEAAAAVASTRTVGFAVPGATAKSMPTTGNHMAANIAGPARRTNPSPSVLSSSWADDEDDDMDFSTPPALPGIEEEAKVSGPVKAPAPPLAATQHKPEHHSPLRNAVTVRHDSAYESMSNTEDDDERDRAHAHGKDRRSLDDGELSEPDHSDDETIFRFEQDEVLPSTPTPAHRLSQSSLRSEHTNSATNLVMLATVVGPAGSASSSSLAASFGHSPALLVSN